MLTGRRSKESEKRWRSSMRRWRKSPSPSPGTKTLSLGPKYHLLLLKLSSELLEIHPNWSPLSYRKKSSSAPPLAKFTIFASSSAHRNLRRQLHQPLAKSKKRIPPHQPVDSNLTTSLQPCTITPQLPLLQVAWYSSPFIPTHYMISISISWCSWINSLSSFPLIWLFLCPGNMEGRKEEVRFFHRTPSLANALSLE